MRCRDIFKTLPKINHNLGRRFSGNGDFLSFVIEGTRLADPNYGPVITQRIDYNLFANFDRERAFLLEDASYPAFAAWYVEGVRPGLSHLSAMWRTLKNVAARWFQRSSSGPIGYAFHDLLSGEISSRSSVLLCMGLDKGNGTMTLDGTGYMHVDWPSKDSMALYDAIMAAGRRFRERVQAKYFCALPNWWWPFRNNVTVHALGGCILADNEQQGVTSAAKATMGQVFGYPGLYVADGAVVPTAVGANPTATIAALAECIAEGITQMKPDSQL